MSTWAYECRAPGAFGAPWFVSCLIIDTMPAGTHIVRVKVDSDWVCAKVDRRRRVDVEAMLLRDVIASDEADCPECAEQPDAAPPAAVEAGPQAAAPPRRQVDAAAVSMQGHRFIVVLVRLDLIDSPGEADMAIADFRPRFGGVDVVLMGQEDDGTPRYHGKPELVRLLDTVPVDRMPWKSYPI